MRPLALLLLVAGCVDPARLGENVRGVVSSCQGQPNGVACGSQCRTGGHCMNQMCIGAMPVPNGTACSTGNLCLIGETCTGGNCRGGVPAPVGTPCFTGMQCTMADTCDVAGACQPGPPLDCDDGDPCTNDSCDPTQGCVHSSICDAPVVDAAPTPDAALDAPGHPSCEAGQICGSGGAGGGGGSGGAGGSGPMSDGGAALGFYQGGACDCQIGGRGRTTPWALLAVALLITSRARAARARGSRRPAAR